jgi:hypothetical protein
MIEPEIDLVGEVDRHCQRNGDDRIFPSGSKNALAEKPFQLVLHR